MKRAIAIVSAALITTGVVAAPAAVYAQTASTTSSASSTTAAGSTAGSAAKANFSDAQLKSFANATQSVASLSQQYTKQIQAAGKDNQKITQIRSEANTKMVQAVQKNGLSVAKFNQIGEAIEQDPQLLKRVQAMVQQK